MTPHWFGVVILAAKKRNAFRYFRSKIYDQSGGLEFVKLANLFIYLNSPHKVWVAFVQLKHRFNDQWSAEAGTRYEDSYAQIDSFVPLSQLGKLTLTLFKAEK